MKGSIKAVVIALSLILTCSLLLQGSMLMLVFGNEAPRTYERHFLDIESIKNTLNMSSTGAPQSQQDLKKRLFWYSHISHDQETVTLFSTEQYKELLEGHQKKTIEGLNYEAALYLLADTIRMYSDAEHIILSGMENGVYETLRMDYTDMLYTKARQAYQQALRSIFYITLFRIAVLDGGLAYVGENYQLELVKDVNMLTKGQYLLLLDRPKNEEPLKRLQAAYDRYRLGRSFEGQLLIFNSDSGQLSVVEYGKSTYLFPSEEIQEKAPWRNKDFATESEKLTVCLYHIGKDQTVPNSRRAVRGEEMDEYINALHTREIAVSDSNEVRRVKEGEVLYRVDLNAQTIYFPADLPVFKNEEVDPYCIVVYDERIVHEGYPFTVPIPRKFVKMIYELYA
ncbi:MAG: hypothetical protein IJX08_02340 [Clostridia bacterium]|nr:hypothetical protein [Clostridia bacterium]